MIKRNSPCWCGSGEKWKKCHSPDIGPQKEQEQLIQEYYKKWGILLKTEQEIQGIRKASLLAADILNKTCKMAKEGVTTQELNDFTHQLHVEANATPASLNYGSPPYPKSICISLNEVICHGIADDRPLKKGDIANLDVACILDGYYGDCSRMVSIGRISDEKQLVMDVSYECLMQSIAILKPGVLISDIGKVIEDIAYSKGCSVVNMFVGHGVGINFHESPQVPHCRNETHVPCVKGMTFTIEPMINAGVRDAIIDPYDHWTARTADGRASAQWEHTILITDNGHEILTKADWSFDSSQPLKGRDS